MEHRRSEEEDEEGEEIYSEINDSFRDQPENNRSRDPTNSRNRQQFNASEQRRPSAAPSSPGSPSIFSLSTLIYYFSSLLVSLSISHNLISGIKFGDSNTSSSSSDNGYSNGSNSFFDFDFLAAILKTSLLLLVLETVKMAFLAIVLVILVALSAVFLANLIFLSGDSNFSFASFFIPPSSQQNQQSKKPK